MGFRADTVEGLRATFREAVGDYFDTCARIGKAAQRAFPGHVIFRIDPAPHRMAALAAELFCKSLNPWVEETLASAAARTAG